MSDEHQHHRPAKGCCARELERTSISVAEVVELLEGIEQHRDVLVWHDATLTDWLLNSPDFSKAWHDFTAGGGISGSDFRAYMSGQFRRRPGVRQRRHLRLIASAPNPITHRRHNNPDPEAA
jgi:hypothetical protein